MQDNDPLVRIHATKAAAEGSGLRQSSAALRELRLTAGGGESSEKPTDGKRQKTAAIQSALRTALADPDPFVRRAAAESIAAHPAAENVAPLLALLRTTQARRRPPHPRHAHRAAQPAPRSRRPRGPRARQANRRRSRARAGDAARRIRRSGGGIPHEVLREPGGRIRRTFRKARSHARAQSPLREARIALRAGAKKARTRSRAARRGSQRAALRARSARHPAGRDFALVGTASGHRASRASRVRSRVDELARGRSPGVRKSVGLRAAQMRRWNDSRVHVQLPPRRKAHRRSALVRIHASRVAQLFPLRA